MSLAAAHRIVLVHRPGVLLLFDTFLQLFDLIFEELAQELTKFIERDFARFVVIQHREHNFVPLLQVQAFVAARVDSFEEALDKCLDFISL